MEHLKVVKQAKEDFSKEVERFAAEADCSYFDALLEVVAKRDLEVEVIPKLLTSRLKELLEQDAIDLNLLAKKKAATLPLDD